MDQIPNFAVLMNYWDRPENMLAQMGMGDMDSNGGLVFGTENFDLYNDAESSSSAVGDWSAIFSSQDTLGHYHMVFFPCICGHEPTPYLTMLTNWVVAGGKIYGSCYSGHWGEYPFPDGINFSGNDSGLSPGTVDEYNTM